jgi:hypothetical protein
MADQALRFSCNSSSTAVRLGISRHSLHRRRGASAVGGALVEGGVPLGSIRNTAVSSLAGGLTNAALDLKLPEQQATN